jgi:hypothetical protein
MQRPEDTRKGKEKERKDSTGYKIERLGMIGTQVFL